MLNMLFLVIAQSYILQHREIFPECSVSYAWPVSMKSNVHRYLLFSYTSSMVKVAERVCCFDEGSEFAQTLQLQYDSIHPTCASTTALRFISLQPAAGCSDRCLARDHANHWCCRAPHFARSQLPTTDFTSQVIFLSAGSSCSILCFLRRSITTLRRRAVLNVSNMNDNKQHDFGTPRGCGIEECQ